MAYKRDITDLQQQGSGEESHIGWKVKQRIHQHAFVDDEGIQASAFSFDGTGHTDGPRADDDEVVHGAKL